jgi:predicted nucleic acid-binding protein
VALIVLDTDVVSLHRAGRLPVGFARQVAKNDLSVTFATAGELWKGAVAKRWGDARRGGLDLWLAVTTIIPAGLAVARVLGSITTAARRRGRPRPVNDSWSRPAASRAGCRC